MHLGGGSLSWPNLGALVECLADSLGPWGMGLRHQLDILSMATEVGEALPLLSPAMNLTQGFWLSSAPLVGAY